MKRSWVLIACLALLCLPSATPAAGPGDESNVLKLFPEQVDFYLGLPDLTTAYPKIRSMFVDGIGEKGEKHWSQLENMVTGALPLLSQQLGFDAKEALRELKGVHLVLPASSRPGMVPDFVIAVEATSKDYLKKILDEKLAGHFPKKNDHGGITIYEFSIDGPEEHLVTFGAAVVNDVGLFGTLEAVRRTVDRGQGKSQGPSLATNAEIKKLLATGKGVPLIVSSVDFGKLWRATKRHMHPYMRDAMEMFDAVAGMSDIPNISYINTLEDLGTSAFSIAFAPESEIYPLIRQKGTEKKAMLSMIPANAFATAVCSFDDVGATVKSVIGWIAANEENWGLPAARMDRVLKNEFPREMGMMFDNFVNACGNEVGFFWLMPEEGFKAMHRGPTGFVFLFEFKTAKDAENILAAFRKNFSHYFQEEIYKGISLSVSDREREGPPAICAIGKYGVITFSDARDQGKGCIDAVKRMIDVVKGDAPAIADAKEFRALLAKLPAKNSRTILVNWEELAKAIDASGEIPFAFERYCVGWREAAVFVDGEKEMTLHSASNRPALTGVSLMCLETTLTMFMGTMSVGGRYYGSNQVILFDEPRKEKDPPAFASDADRELRIDDLIRQLDDDDPILRQKATEELVAIGEPVVKKVRTAFHAPVSDEARSRTKSILFELGNFDIDPESVRLGVEKIVAYLGSPSIRMEGYRWEGRPVLYDRASWDGQEPSSRPDFSLLRSNIGVKAFWEKAKSANADIRCKAAVVLSQCPTVEPIAKELLDHAKNVAVNPQGDDDEEPIRRYRSDDRPGEGDLFLYTLAVAGGRGIQGEVAKVLVGRLSAANRHDRYTAVVNLERFMDDTCGYNPFHNGERRLKAIRAIEKRMTAGDESKK